jgi:hypothetical protein
VDLNYKGPTEIELVGRDIPTKVVVEMEKPIPEKILVEQVKPIPEEILVKHDIPSELSITGMPESLEITIPENMGIPVIFPDKMPEMELVYKGAPIEMKITMDEMIAQNEDGNNCVMITPCPR